MDVMLLCYASEFSIIEEPNHPLRPTNRREFDLIADIRRARPVDVIVGAVVEEIVAVAAFRV